MKYLSWKRVLPYAKASQKKWVAFVFVAMVEFVFGLGIALVVQAMLLAPLAWLFGIDISPSGYLAAFVRFGIGAWVVAFITAIIVGCVFLFDTDYAARKVMNRVARKVGDKICANIFVRWYRAVHDKICPTLTFQ